jgi:hypothetical protein
MYGDPAAVIRETLATRLVSALQELPGHHHALDLVGAPDLGRRKLAHQD